MNCRQTAIETASFLTSGAACTAFYAAVVVNPIPGSIIGACGFLGAKTASWICHYTRMENCVLKIATYAACILLFASLAALICTSIGFSAPLAAILLIQCAGSPACYVLDLLITSIFRLYMRPNRSPHEFHNIPSPSENPDHARIVWSVFLNPEHSPLANPDPELSFNSRFRRNPNLNPNPCGGFSLNS